VRVDRVDLSRGEEAPQREDAARPLAADRERGRRDAEARRLGKKARLARTRDFDAVAAGDHAGGFGEDADLLSAPPERSLGMNDAH